MANVNKYLIQDSAYPLQTYMSLTDGEVGVISHLINVGFLSGDVEIVNLTEMEYINPSIYYKNLDEADSEV